MEKDNELKGEGNSLDFGARLYDSRIGRWMIVDPMFKKQPQWSTYKAFFNNPIIYVDPEGETEFLVVSYTNTQTGEQGSLVLVIDEDKVQEQRYSIVEGHSYANMYRYSDIIHRQTIIVDENGNTHTSKKTEFVERYTRHPLLRWLPEIVDISLSGEGGFVEGGYYYTTDVGGIHPSKFKSLSDAPERDVTGLIDALAAKGLKASLGSKHADMINDASSLVQKGNEVHGNTNKEKPSQQLGEQDTVCCKKHKNTHLGNGDFIQAGNEGNYREVEIHDKE
jgi:RHS repeat-associated protein